MLGKGGHPGSRPLRAGTDLDQQENEVIDISGPMARAPAVDVLLGPLQFCGRDKVLDSPGGWTA
ncbi:hypothetical protein Ssi03_36240 [Sphaerisporangium siamense]|nr:hypothetical protein Ssi03_36240 [Sphaerisporangium siamense]